ncbi:MAG: hypothetical protein ACPLRH_03515 [Desulfotomaculales bacterium]
MPVYRRNLNAGPGVAAPCADFNHDMDKREVMLFGDVYRVNCPRCGETEAVCITPFAQAVFCILCGGAVGKERVISFLRSAMLDLEELG